MRYRVLVFEDDCPLADVLRMKLAREGDKVAVARTGEEAYRLLENRAFDFVVLDLRLPADKNDMNRHNETGLRILHHMRARLSREGLPVIVMTAHEEISQTAVRALRALANDYVTKPSEDCSVSRDDKLPAIARVIEKSRPMRKGGSPRSAAKKHEIVFKRDGVYIEGIRVTGRADALLRLLGSRALTQSQAGLAKGDVPMPGKDIAAALDVTEETVRKYVSRFRNRIASAFKRLGKGPIDKQDIVRNARDWKGYEFNFVTCHITRE